MIIQYASDLHIELTNNNLYLHKNPIKPIGDILILAGDIGYWDQRIFDLSFFDDLSKNFKAVYYLPGNHEFYLDQDIKILRKPICKSIRENVHLVSNVVVTIDDVDFFFTPLWTQIPTGKDHHVQSYISDFRKIKYRNQLYSVKDHNNFHNRARRFLFSAVAASQAQKKIVVTHFVPTFKCENKMYKTSKIKDFFYSELYDYIENSDIDYWIYGHSHYNMPWLQIGGTNLVTNQLGYVYMNEHQCFNHSASFKL